MADSIDVLFVCLHGSAKSVIAAAHLRRLAAARGLSLHAASAGIEPDAAIPAHVVAGLVADGLSGPFSPPVQASEGAVASARHVVSFGCDLSALLDPTRGVEQWDGVPHVSEGYEVARDAIVALVSSLLDAVAPPAEPGPEVVHLQNRKTSR